MSPERWQAIKQVLADAAALSGGAREDYLQRACGGDAELLKEVRSFLDPGEETASGPSSPAPLEEGFTIQGRFVVQRKLGAGGFASAYVARDRLLHNRPVVIKVLSGAHVQDAWVERKFDEELGCAT